MEKKLLLIILLLGSNYICSFAQQHTFENVQIKDISADEESDWQASQVQAKIIALSHQRFEIDLFDNLTRKTPTLSYQVRYLGSQENKHKYGIMMLNGVQIVNPGPGDFIQTSVALEDMAQGKTGTVAINEDALKEIVIYKLE